jgi:hypothetical protein
MFRSIEAIYAAYRCALFPTFLLFQRVSALALVSIRIFKLLRFRNNRFKFSVSVLFFPIDDHNIGNCDIHAEAKQRLCSRMTQNEIKFSLD